jgi:hypothetical protein
MNATMTRKECNDLANAHAAISAAGAAGLTSRQIRDAGVLPSDWAVEQLLARKMIVRLPSIPGVHCVDGRFATVRNAK